MIPKVLFQGDILNDIANNIMNNINNYMIDSDGKLFTKCNHCDAWHLISEMKIKRL